MSTLLDNSKKLTWPWNGKHTPLGKLKDGQLYYIRKMLNSSSSNWHGQSKDYWLNAIKPIIKERERSAIDYLSKEIAFRHRLRIDKSIETQLVQARLLKTKPVN